MSNRGEKFLRGLVGAGNKLMQARIQALVDWDCQQKEQAQLDRQARLDKMNEQLTNAKIAKLQEVKAETPVKMEHGFAPNGVEYWYNPKTMETTYGNNFAKPEKTEKNSNKFSIKYNNTTFSGNTIEDVKGQFAEAGYGMSDWRKAIANQGNKVDLKPGAILSARNKLENKYREPYIKVGQDLMENPNYNPTLDIDSAITAGATLKPQEDKSIGGITKSIFGEFPTTGGVTKPASPPVVTAIPTTPGSPDKRSINLPPDLQGDAEAQGIVEDFNNGNLTYDDAVDLLVQKREENANAGRIQGK